MLGLSYFSLAASITSCIHTIHSFSWLAHFFPFFFLLFIIHLKKKGTFKVKIGEPVITKQNRQKHRLERDKYMQCEQHGHRHSTIDRANVPYFWSHCILQFEKVYDNEILTDLYRRIHFIFIHFFPC